MSPARSNDDPSHPHGATLESMPASSTPTIDVSLERSEGDFSAQSLWQHRLSASFAAMADQIAATSQALALVPSTASSELGVLKNRLEGIEQTQTRMAAELEAFKKQSGNENVNGHAITVGEEGTQMATKLEALEKTLNTLSETVALDQQRLPARLQNARATVMKAPLVPLVMANGKPAPGFPNTRGEFEHITKERYEALLKAYGLPDKGDTEAKREAMRVFAGIPRDGQ